MLRSQSFNTPGINRIIASATTAAASSPPESTKSPILISLVMNKLSHPLIYALIGDHKGSRGFDEGKVHWPWVGQKSFPSGVI